MRYGSVCSGIEAATMAWHPLGWQPSFFSEIDKFPRAVLEHHYPGVPLHGDFTTIGADQHDAIDLLVGGTPCQSFSIAGLRGGLGDDRGNLALEYFRLAQRLRARWLVWENVPGVLSSSGGRDFGAILGAMAELGYGFAYRVLDAQYVRTLPFPWAVPQRRRRVFVVGYLGDWRRAAAVLFDRESLCRNPAPRREAGQAVAPTISARPTGGGGLGTDFDIDGGLIASTGDVSHCLNAGGMKRNDYETETMVAHIFHQNGGGHAAIAFDTTQITSPQNGANPRPGDPCHPLPAGAHPPAIAIQERATSENPNNGPDGAGFRTDGASYTLEARSVPQSIASNWAVRRLTPRECERLQGFPDDFTQIPWRGKPADQCPDGHRYKALGNSMAVNVMSWIGERIQMVEGLKT